jgi:hypothetical protein
VGVTRSSFALALGLALSLPAPARAEVRVTMKDGLVTVAANGATVREILAEWAKVGQTRIVNAERISGAPLTIQLTDVPEAQALDIVLRSVSGYLAAPREEISPTLSRFDRVLVLPTSTPPRNVPPPAPAQAPAAQRPPFQPPPFQPRDDEPDDEPVQRTPAQTAPFSVFPPPPGVPGQPPSPARSQPSAPPATTPFGGQTPMGVTVPGMIVPAPAPQQPGVPPPDQR